MVYPSFGSKQKKRDKSVLVTLGPGGGGYSGFQIKGVHQMGANVKTQENP